MLTIRVMLRPVIFAFAALGVGLSSAQAANPDALWHIVHDFCEPAAQGANVQQKCVDVESANGFAVLKDINGIAQYLLIPTARVSGIESPDLLTPTSPNYWRDAWQARHFVEAKMGRDLPRDGLSLAVNSSSGRTQNQLHIHIDCLAPDVVAALRAQGPRIGTAWMPFPTLLRGHTYRIRRIDDANLDSTDPFKLLAPDAALQGQLMADQTLLLAGAIAPDGKPAFFLLNDHVQRESGDFASSEELQDHSCAIGREQ
jgi:CDP-diacylglycerol pyrophosphatase